MKPYALGLMLVAMGLLACSVSLFDNPPTPTSVPTAPPTIAPTPTVPPSPTPTRTPAPSPTPNPAQGEVDELRARGLIHYDGRFVRIDSNFTISEARRNFWIYYPIEGSGELQDFAIGADIAWDSASEKPDWWNTGCGFFIRPRDDDGVGGYFVAETSDGLPWLLWWNPGEQYLVDLLRPSTYDYFALSSTGKRTGSLHIVAIAEGPELRFLVDGDERYHRDNIVERSGFLGAVVVSGTNKDYGTRCTFSNAWLFALDT